MSAKNELSRPYGLCEIKGPKEDVDFILSHLPDIEYASTKQANPAQAAVPSDEQIEEIARKHGTGGWQTLADMVRFGKAVLAAKPKETL